MLSYYYGFTPHEILRMTMSQFMMYNSEIPNIQGLFYGTGKSGEPDIAGIAASVGITPPRM